jgi:hypothetical protein
MLGFVTQERRYDNDYPLEKLSNHENNKAEIFLEFCNKTLDHQ